MLKQFRFIFLLIFLFFFVCMSAQAGEIPGKEKREILPIEPGFYGYPLKYFRLLKPKFPFPNVSGLYVTSVDREKPAAVGGLRRFAIIQKIAGQKVDRMQQVLTVLKKHRGEKVTFSGYELTPSYEKRKRENPFYDPRGRSPYRSFSFQCKYPIRRVSEPEPVYVAAGGSLYHKLGYRHSPDSATAQVFEGKKVAREAGFLPCPICFSGTDDGPSVTKFVSDELGNVEGKVEKEFKKKYGLIKELPPLMEKIKKRLFKYRLCEGVKPKVIYLDTSKFCGLGLPDGGIILTRGLWRAMEAPAEKVFLLAHLLGHFDFRQSPGIESQNKILKLLTKAIKRTTGGEIDFGRLRKIAEYLPAYAKSTYRGFIQQGYGTENEKRALFAGMVYLYKAGYSLDSVDGYVEIIRDLEDYPSPRWMNFELRHPFPDSIDYYISHWKKHIPKEFDRGG